MEVKDRIVKLLVVIIVLAGLILWLGYTSRNAATRVRLGDRKFEPTQARLERGRYNILRTGHAGARKLASIMPWGYFRNMTDDDPKAISAYLRTLRQCSIASITPKLRLPVRCAADATVME